jgi:hypothetical protein
MEIEITWDLAMKRSLREENGWGSGYIFSTSINLCHRRLRIGDSAGGVYPPSQGSCQIDEWGRFGSPGVLL